MRKNLKNINGKRTTFIGEVDKEGNKLHKGYDEDTLMLRNIKNEYGKVLADHLWFNLTKRFADLGELRRGDILSFEARVRRYKKGSGKTDYKLIYPTKIKKVRTTK